MRVSRKYGPEDHAWRWERKKRLEGLYKVSSLSREKRDALFSLCVCLLPLGAMSSNFCFVLYQRHFTRTKLRHTPTDEQTLGEPFYRMHIFNLSAIKAVGSSNFVPWG